jgi:hypothetical protein
MTMLIGYHDPASALVLGCDDRAVFWPSGQTAVCPVPKWLALGRERWLMCNGSLSVWLQLKATVAERFKSLPDRNLPIEPAALEAERSWLRDVTRKSWHTWTKPAQKLQRSVDYVGDSTNVKPSWAAFLRKVAMSRSRVRRSYAVALRSRKGVRWVSR